MDERNFCLDKEGNVCILDFWGVGLLPESFADHTMSTRSGNPFIGKVAGYLDWSDSPNSYSMSRASAIMIKTSDPTFG